MTLEDEVDLTGEQTSGTSHTSITAGDTAPSRDGTYHEEVSKYLAVDIVTVDRVKDCR